MKEENGHSIGDLWRGSTERPGGALEAVYARYRRPLLRYVRSVMGDSVDDELVKDVVSETLIVLWEDWEKISGLEEPYFWMMRVAKNKALHRLREAERHRKVPLDGYEDIPADERADRELLKAELKQLIEQACETLTPAERAIFVGSKIEELTNEELEKRYKLAKQTVRNRLSQALRKVRVALSELLGVVL